LKRLDF